MKLKYELLTAYMVDEGVISSREKQALRDIVEAAEGGLDPSVVASTEKLAHRAKLGCVRLKASTSGHQLVKTSIQADIMRNEAWMRKSVIRCLFGYMDDVGALLNDAVEEKLDDFEELNLNLRPDETYFEGVMISAREDKFDVSRCSNG